ncbi:MAG: pyridoxamine 5'-phosphate oxidase [Phycisphaeraceae bacterium]|nr:pyridoxamine 5'-phosphate oxidase [Phycisphaeraceae bacterium]
MQPQDMRIDYPGKPLLENEVASDPVAQFEIWFEAASKLDPEMANSTALATVAADGRPTVRMVLLKGIEDGSFVFYTNYDSDKAADLAREPRASLCFWWPLLLRQVRVEGTVEKISAQRSDAYFHSRPRGSQIGAVASDQSRIIADRSVLEQRAAELEKRYENREIPRPDNWGGYRLKPVMFEFWQGRLNRLHDRLRYRHEADQWKIERLAP